ncbi:hypothetical protein TSMEX_004434 [Taenia solium]|eukprot:TsM_000441600 transcript=TsM_000441600 gene=TsM_000441600
MNADLAFVMTLDVLDSWFITPCVPLSLRMGLKMRGLQCGSFDYLLRHWLALEGYELWLNLGRIHFLLGSCVKPFMLIGDTWP